MKIVIAPNAFRGSLTAVEVADAVEQGVLWTLPDAEIVKIPVADGGDGTMAVMVAATGGAQVEVEVVNPLGEPITAAFGVLGDGITGVVEMSAAAGTRLIPRNRLNPLVTTTYGVGQLIAAAVEHGCKRVLVGLGGSATVDGGLGMAQALGVRALDKAGNPARFIGDVQTVEMDDLDPHLAGVEIIGISDVENPLLGETGGVQVFSPQKGASPEVVEQLERAMTHYADVVAAHIGQDYRDEPRTGAAGGLGFGLRAFLNAQLQPGVETILDILRFDDRLRGADLVFTGEGKIDGQTIYGKAPIGVAKRAAAQNIPVIAVAGWVADDADAVFDHGIRVVMPISPHPMTLDEALRRTPELVAAAAERAMRLVQLGRS